MKKIIIANWKLNPATLKEAAALAAKVEKKPRHKAVLCPPAVFLSAVSYPNIGAQDCFWTEKGAFTGQVSPLQLRSLKVKYCIVGHSEKRALGETDEMANAKVRTLLEHKITPVLCVGYGTTVEQDELEAVDILRKQLEAGLMGADAEKTIVAYEPVWAIGTGKNASPEHAESMSLFIKAKYGVLKALYGGSVNVFNAAGYLKQPNVDGLLVGGDSLIAGHFNDIINMRI